MFFQQSPSHELGISNLGSFPVLTYLVANRFQIALSWSICIFNRFIGIGFPSAVVSVACRFQINFFVATFVGGVRF